MPRDTSRFEPAEPGRPPLVWFIAGWYCWGLVATVFSFAIIAAGVLPMPDAQKRYFDSLTAFDYFCSASGIALNLTAAAALVALRRVAYPLFVAALALGVAATAYQVAAKEWLAAMGPMAPGAVVGTVVGWSIHVAVIFYARSLARRGVLR